jgi:hypothetical protein
MGQPAAAAANNNAVEPNDPNANRDGANNNNSSVINDPSLPEELRGKTAAEIVQYYKNREESMSTRMEDLIRQANNPPKQDPPPVVDPPSSSEWWNDPNSAVKKVAVTREEFDQASQSVQRSMIDVAQIVAQKKFKDWDKWEKDVLSIMNTVPAHMRTDPEQWATAYYYVKGHKFDNAVEEAGAKATRLASEPPTPAPSVPTVPKELTKEQKYVADKLGMTSEKFRDGIKNDQDNNWPITFDSRKKR